MVKHIRLFSFSDCIQLLVDIQLKHSTKAKTVEFNYKSISRNTIEFYNQRSRIVHADAEEKMIFLFDYRSVFRNISLPSPILSPLPYNIYYC